jgi:hypothetical protein
VLPHVRHLDLGPTVWTTGEPLHSLSRLDSLRLIINKNKRGISSFQPVCFGRPMWLVLSKWGLMSRLIPRDADATAHLFSSILQCFPARTGVQRRGWVMATDCPSLRADSAPSNLGTIDVLRIKKNPRTHHLTTQRVPSDYSSPPFDEPPGPITILRDPTLRLREVVSIHVVAGCI